MNTRIGGKPDSEHLYNVVGKGAVDVCVRGASSLEVEKWIDQNWNESVGYGQAKNRGFTHVGCRGDGQRRRWDY